MIWFVFVIILLGVLGLAMCQYHWKRRHLYIAASKYNGPTCLPILGNALSFHCKNEEILYRISDVMKTFEQQPMRFWLGQQLMICFANPIHVEKILSSSKLAYKHDIYKFIKVFLGEGLVSASGPVYRNHKKVIQPLFGNKFCEDSLETFHKHVENCVEKLKAKFVDQDTFDIHDVIANCFIDIVGDSILGCEMKAQHGENRTLIDAFVRAYDLIIARMVRPWLQPDIVYRNSSLGKEQSHINNIRDDFFSKIITDSKKRVKRQEESTAIIDQITRQANDDPQLLNDRDFISHMGTLFLASEDTMAIIVSMACVCFGMYPEHQKKAAEEICQIFGEKPRPVLLEDIPKLEYLDMCIKDIYRLMPIAPFILRRTLDDCQIGEWFLPKGCGIVIPIFNIHRNDKYWEQPKHFHPDHFLPENIQNRHPYSYVPFSAGPRSCIGKIFANLVLKITLATLLQHFEFWAEGQFPDIPLKMDISVRPIKGYKCSVSERKWNNKKQ